MLPIRDKTGEAPCGECHLQPGETCDVCHAQQPRLVDLPFITATSAAPDYYVTVKVRDIKALHAAHDVVLKAFGVI